MYNVKSLSNTFKTIKEEKMKLINFLFTLIITLAGLSIANAQSTEISEGDWVIINAKEFSSMTPKPSLPNIKGGLLVVETKGSLIVAQASNCDTLIMNKIYFKKITKNSTKGQPRKICQLNLGDQVILSRKEWNDRVSQGTPKITSGVIKRIDNDVITVEDKQGISASLHREYWRKRK